MTMRYDFFYDSYYSANIAIVPPNNRKHTPYC